jgi:hypothetical protein
MKLEMTSKERKRMAVMVRLSRGDLTQAEAGEELGVSVRQIRRIKRRWGQEGDGGVIHRGRGRRSNHAHREKFRLKVMERVKEKYTGYGPTLAVEALRREGMRVGRETLRGWLKEERAQGEWERRGRKVRRKSRARRERLGELVQMDTSIHPWLGKDGEKCVLIAMIDDATSRLWARFYAEDGTGSNMGLLKEYMERFGRPLALYTDRATHFVSPAEMDVEESYRGSRPRSQIQRALEELGVELILARSPEAKGRIERAFRTLQDRLLKALREHGVKTIRGANEYLRRSFLKFWNTRFAIEPALAEDAHQALGAEQDLEAILSVQEERTVARDHTISIDGRKTQIVLEQPLGDLRPGCRVIVERRLDGTRRIRWKMNYLRFEVAGTRATSSVWRGGNSSRATPSLRYPRNQKETSLSSLEEDISNGL